MGESRSFGGPLHLHGVLGFHPQLNRRGVNWSERMVIGTISGQRDPRWEADGLRPGLFSRGESDECVDQRSCEVGERDARSTVSSVLRAPHTPVSLVAVGLTGQRGPPQLGWAIDEPLCRSAAPVQHLFGHQCGSSGPAALAVGGIGPGEQRVMVSSVGCVS